MFKGLTVCNLVFAISHLHKNYFLLCVIMWQFLQLLVNYMVMLCHLIICIENTDPAEAQQFPMEYLEKVKTVHSVGGYGSQG